MEASPDRSMSKRDDTTTPRSAVLYLGADYTTYATQVSIKHAELGMI
jgi:hypothetical protein